MYSSMLFFDNCILLCFKAVLRLKINLSKSEIVPGGGVLNLELSGIVGCNVAHLPLKCLGLFLGAQFKSKIIWDGILERMKQRLVSWNKIHLSKGGQLTLI